MGLLARRNLFHDKVRFAVTLTGIVFALALIILVEYAHITAHVTCQYLADRPYMGIYRGMYQPSTHS